MEVDKATPGDPKQRCKYCYVVGHGKNPDDKTRKKLCRAFRLTCFKCPGKGHVASVCPNKKEDTKSNAVATVEEKEEPKDDEAKFLSVKVGLTFELTRLSKGTR